MQITLKPRPYRLMNQMQHYAWGTRGDDAFIPHLLEIEARPDTPYAELWMGAHPKAPSAILVDDREISLRKAITHQPTLTLGKAVADRFEETLPFLFKVLSAADSLSIQVHPTRAQAKRLHEQDPEHYPDANHKPEVAVALTRLIALVGFKPADELATALDAYPKIAEFVGADKVETSTPEHIKTLYARLVQRAVDDPKALARAVRQLADRLQTLKRTLTEVEERFLQLRKKYGDEDVGLFSLFLLNLVHLDRGEGLYTEAGVPHAYLGGDIVECMANSDNVVRAGLTPKYKDVETLVEILTPTIDVPLLDGTLDDGEVIYPTPASEFQVSRWTSTAGESREVTLSNGPEIYLVTQGAVNVRWREAKEAMHVKRGESFFVPATVKRLEIQTRAESELFRVHVPESAD